MPAPARKLGLFGTADANGGNGTGPFGVTHGKPEYAWESAATSTLGCDSELSFVMLPVTSTENLSVASQRIENRPDA